MEAQYKRDLYASYMLIKIPEEADRESYPFRMLKENRMKRILACKERVEDGIAYLYIDISGKKNLTQEFKDQEMELEDMAGIFQQLLPALEELRSYLLTEGMAVLEPEYIYRDMEDGSLYLTLLPWELKKTDNLHKMAEFFLEKMNQRDEHGVTAAYHFYRQQSQPQFSLYHFLPVLEKEMILKRQKSNTGVADKSKIAQMETEDIDLSMQKEEAKEESKMEFPDIERKPDVKNFLWILALAAGAVVLGISFLPMTAANQKISCLALSGVLFILGIVSGLFSVKKRKKREKREKKVISLQKTEEKEERAEMILGGEETVFFDSAEDEDFIRLQWKEKGRTKQVLLKDFPCTVGKIKEEVSIVIQDMSVSRVHCRFVEKERGIGIMDLNSTNGTYLNGMKLKQGEILEIVKNDEILIGKVRVIVV